MAKVTKEKQLRVLNIGTRILIADVMDQYLRSLGEVKTFYSSRLHNAIDSFFDKKPQVVFCEQNLQEGNFLDFIAAIGGLHASRDIYFVLAAEESNDDLISLSAESGVDEILVRPFSNEHINGIVDRYFEKTETFQEDWVRDMRAARLAYEEKRFQEADELFWAHASKYPTNLSVQMECAEFYLRANQPAKTVKILEPVLEVTKQVKVMHLAGIALKRVGRFHEAIDLLDKANSLSPMNTHRAMELADAHLFAAEEQITSALKREGENSNLILLNARYQVSRKNYAGAVTYLDSKRAFLNDGAKKEAELIVLFAKKAGGIR